MRNVSNTWGIVLAGGDGSRLRTLTTAANGEVVPKQYCSMQRESCLLEDAIVRAKAVALPQLVCSVVAAQHRHWWKKAALGALPAANIFVQPSNRGTTHGILLALIQIEARAPDAVVVLLPADHYVSDEHVTARSLRIATNLAETNRGLVYLLGAEPDSADQELGYIVPSEQFRDLATGVVRFVEKPAAERAQRLLREGALWNTFIFAASVRALMSLFEGRFAATIASMRAAMNTQQVAGGQPPLDLIYSDLESSDFSRDVLERHEQVLQVVRLPKCGWTDLGTPRRVQATIRNLTRARPVGNRAAPPSNAVYLDLASHCA
jgi:mannose-1-phosphate guanylyltransferase